MTIIDSLFYASDSLSGDVSLEFVAKLIVAWMYCISIKSQGTKIF